MSQSILLKWCHSTSENHTDDHVSRVLLNPFPSGLVSEAYPCHRITIMEKHWLCLIQAISVPAESGTVLSCWMMLIDYAENMSEGFCKYRDSHWNPVIIQVAQLLRKPCSIIGRWYNDGTVAVKM